MTVVYDQGVCCLIQWRNRRRFSRRSRTSKDVLVSSISLKGKLVKELVCKDSKHQRKSSFKRAGYKKFALLAGKILIARHRSPPYFASTEVRDPLWIQSKTLEPSRADGF